MYYAGDANAGAKTIAINLPNDEEVQLAKGTRRLQLKNAMQAKFDEIMVPITREEDTGKYRVDFAAMREAVSGLSELILTLQGDGDYDGVAQLMEERGFVPAELQADLDRLDSAGIPRDIVFEQGMSVLFGGR